MKIIDNVMSKHQAARNYSKEMESYKWALEIPFIRFPLHWEIRVLPPFIGAIVRFEVKYKDTIVRVALDGYGLLGYAENTNSSHYWRVTALNVEDQSCPMDDTELLIKIIEDMLEASINAN